MDCKDGMQWHDHTLDIILVLHQAKSAKLGMLYSRCQKRTQMLLDQVKAVSSTEERCAKIESLDRCFF
jgi:hypothetical protein